MTINYNSFSSKLYRWLYGTNKMPNNLCPYFWKLIVAFVLAIPIFVLTLPFEIIRLFAKTTREDFNDVPIWGRLFMSALTILFLICVAAVLVPISLFFGYVPEQGTLIEDLFILGTFIWIVAFIFGSIRLFEYLKDRYDSNSGNRKRNKVKGDNIVVEFAKAKYNKYCPKIEWVNNKTEYEYDDF